LRSGVLIVTIAGLFILAAGLVFFLISGEAGAKTRSLRCWRCRNTFEIQAGVSEGDCPSCGAPFVLPAPTPPPRTVAADAIPFQEAGRYLGRAKTIEGVIVNAHLSRATGNLYLYYHQDYRRHVTIKIAAKNVGKFPPNPAGYYKGKTVRATGRIQREGSFLEQEITDPSNLVVIDSPSRPVSFNARPTPSRSQRKRTISRGYSAGAGGPDDYLPAAEAPSRGGNGSDE